MKENFSALAAMVCVLGLFASDVLAQGCNSVLASREHFPCCADFNVPIAGTDNERTCVGPATTYLFTIDSFGFEDSSGTVTWMGSPTEFDAASVSAGSDMGTFVSGGVLADGTYVAVRPKVNRTFQVTANILTQDGRLCSGSASGGMRGHSGAMPVCGAGEPNATRPQCVDGDNVTMRATELGSLVHSSADPISIGFVFYTDNAATCTFPAGGVGNGTLSLGSLHVDMIAN